MIGSGHRFHPQKEHDQQRAISSLPAATAATMGKCRRIVLIAIMVALGVTALGLGGAQQARAEPPDPCRHARCGF
jgi:hypothetical protein